MSEIPAEIAVRRVILSDSECRFETFPLAVPPDPAEPGEVSIDKDGNLTQIIPISSSVDCTVYSIFMNTAGWKLDKNTPIFVSDTDFPNCSAPVDPNAPFPGGIYTRVVQDILQLVVPKSSDGAHEYYYALHAVHKDGRDVWLHPKIRNDNAPDKNSKLGFVTRLVRQHPVLAMSIVGGAALIVGIYLGGGWR